MLQYIKILNYKFLVIDQTIYQEQMYTRLSNLVDNHCWEYYNGILSIQSNITILLH